MKLKYDFEISYPSFLYYDIWSMRYRLRIDIALLAHL